MFKATVEITLALPRCPVKPADASRYIVNRAPLSSIKRWIDSSGHRSIFFYVSKSTFGSYTARRLIIIPANWFLRHIDVSSEVVVKKIVQITKRVPLPLLIHLSAGNSTGFSVMDSPLDDVQGQHVVMDAIFNELPKIVIHRRKGENLLISTRR